MLRSSARCWLRFELGEELRIKDRIILALGIINLGLHCLNQFRWEKDLEVGEDEGKSFMPGRLYDPIIPLASNLGGALALGVLKSSTMMFLHLRHTLSGCFKWQRENQVIAFLGPGTK